MTKLVVLRLEGDLQYKGFHALLEIGTETGRADIEISGVLPPNPKLADRLYEHWQKKYRQVEPPYPDGGGSRLKPKQIWKDDLPITVAECQVSGKELQDELDNWLKADSFRKIDICLREELSKEEDVRILLRTDDWDAKKLPWHLWDFCRNYPRSDIVLSCLEAKQIRVLPPEPGDRVKILAILGNRKGIDLDRDREFLEQLPNTEIQFLVEPTQQQIGDALWRHTWDIVFFAGHSQTQGKTGKIFINACESIPIDDLWASLRKAVERGLQLVIFNSCDGLGLARELDDFQIPIAIVMREIVPDKVAQLFLQYFLESLVTGVPLHLAVREARERLTHWENQYPCASWLPVIHQHPKAILPAWKQFLQPKREVNAPRSPFQKRDRFPMKLSCLAASLALAAVGIHQIAFPQIARSLNEKGIEKLENGELGEALKYFKRSLKFNRNQPNALNNMGFVYEDLQEMDLASHYYRQAKKKGSPAGCSNEARLDIESQNYDRAEDLLRKCLNLTDTDVGRYSIQKNLGWALLAQHHYNEAEETLRNAIDLLPDAGAANCLLAQVLEGQDRTDEALPQWESCWQNASDYYPEEIEWKRQAEQRLNTVSYSYD